MTQGELTARLAQRGYRLSRPAINAIERRKRGVSLDDALAIAAALGVAPVNMIVPFEDPEPINDEVARKGIFRPTALLSIGELELDPGTARAWIRGVETFPEATFEERQRFHVDEVAPPARYRLLAMAEGETHWKLAEEERTKLGYLDAKTREPVGLDALQEWALGQKANRRRRSRS